MVSAQKSLEQYLALEYPFNVIADPEGGYVIMFPDLPGCMTQVETLDEVGPMAEEVRRLWIETTYEDGMEVPLPSYPEEYSGKFNVRLPRSLHRSLAQAAEREGVSLNQYVLTLLARGDAQARVERQIRDLAGRLRNSAESEIEADLGSRSEGTIAPRSAPVRRPRQERKRAS